MRLRSCVAAAVCLALAAGCSAHRVEVTAVTGVVTLGGRPLPRVAVRFLPAGGAAGAPASSGTTDARGGFELALERRVGRHEAGAVVGPHVVVLEDYNRPVAPPIPPPKIRARYSLPHAGPLRVEVREGATFRFEVDRLGGVQVKPGP